MADILKKDNIILNAEFKNKTEAIQQAGKILLQQGYVTEQYIELMLKREESVSTYIGNNLAIPHGTENSNEEIIKSGISIIQVPDGVDFGSNNLAYIVMGIAGKDNTHLDMLSEIALICSEEENIINMKEAQNKEDIIDTLGSLSKYK